MRVQNEIEIEDDTQLLNNKYQVIKEIGKGA